MIGSVEQTVRGYSFLHRISSPSLAIEWKNTASQVLFISVITSGLTVLLNLLLIDVFFGALVKINAVNAINQKTLCGLA
jgi:hypothetical protein